MTSEKDWQRHSASSLFTHSHSASPLSSFLSYYHLILRSLSSKAMPTYTHPSSSPPPKRDLSAVLSDARPFLRGELEKVDPDLPALASILRAAGAGECYHKHGNFLSHLLDTYRILKLWHAPDSVARCGLFHSSYSNSYVNLAIFDAGTSRGHVRSIIGEPAEELVHLFCIVPRHKLIFHDLLVHYTDSELVEHLAASETSVKEAKEKGVFDSSEPWRKKLQVQRHYRL